MPDQRDHAQNDGQHYETDDQLVHNWAFAAVFVGMTAFSASGFLPPYYGIF